MKLTQKIALIDADIVAFRAAAVSNDDDTIGACISRIDFTMELILDTLDTKQYMGWLTGGNNFRKILYPEYKANRKYKELPRYLNGAKEYLVDKWKIKVTDGWETDDELGIHLTELGERGVCCSNDKDLKQVPGRHMNFTWIMTSPAQIFENIDETRGMYNFYSQMLIGDTADNVKGVPGIGIKRSRLALSSSDDPSDWERTVSDLYKQHNLDYELNSYLLWIARTRNYLEETCAEAVERYTLMQEKETSPSSELTTQEEIGFQVLGQEEEVST